MIQEDGIFRRIVTPMGKDNYEAFLATGLYETLVKKNFLIEHKEISLGNSPGYKKLEPKQIPVITYPYEWSFSQLKDAALLTLVIQENALRHDMSLKDATPFNVQFWGSQPIWIDTLSFEPATPRPWVAYKQFCEVFLAPLVLMSKKDEQANRYLRVDIHGMKLETCSHLLPLSTYFNLKIFLHIHLHAKSQKKYRYKENGCPPQKALKISPLKQRALIDQLKNMISELDLPAQKSPWSDYYEMEKNPYPPEAELFKKQFVAQALEKMQPTLVCDFGGNTGKFSRISSKKGIYTVSMDVDPLCVQLNYMQAKAEEDKNLLPLLMDLTNPSPSLGWYHRERPALFDRISCDFGLALALIHHLRLSHNVPMEKLATFFGEVTKNLIIEFIPKEDPMAKKLLEGREDIYKDYDLKAFEQAFQKYFLIHQKAAIPNTSRILYWLTPHE